MNRTLPRAVLLPQLESTHRTRQENICLQKGKRTQLSVLTGIEGIVTSTYIITQRVLDKSNPASAIKQTRGFIDSRFY